MSPENSENPIVNDIYNEILSEEGMKDHGSIQDGEGYAPGNEDDQKSDPPSGEGDDSPAGDGDAPVISLDDFNKKTGSEFKNPDEVFSSWEKKNNDLSVLKSKSEKFNEETFKDLQEKVSKYDETLNVLGEEINPLSHFANEDQYRLQQALKKHPDKDPSVLSALFSADIDKLRTDDPDRLLQLHYMNEFGYTAEEANMMIDEDFSVGIDPDEEGYDRAKALSQAKKKRAASEAVKSLKDMKEGIELPEKKDIKSMLEARKVEQEKNNEKTKKTWEPLINKVVENFVKDGFSHVNKDKEGKTLFEFSHKVDPEWAKNKAEPIVNMVAKSGMELNEDNLKTVGSLIKRQYILDNFESLLKTYGNQEANRIDQMWVEETNNPSKLERKVRPDSGSKTKQEEEDERVNNEVLKELGGF